jgi:hypothetical protein
MTMEPKDLLPILFERSNAVGTLWNIEIVVILGLIGFLAAAGPRMNKPFLKLALTAGFVIAAGFNLAALIEVTEQRQALVDFFRTIKPPVLATPSGWIDPLFVPSLWWVAILHVIVDALMIGFVWWYPQRAPAA